MKIKNRYKKCRNQNKKRRKTMYKVTLTYAYRELDFLFEDLQRASFFISDVLCRYDRSGEKEEKPYERLKVTISLVESEVESDELQTTEG